MLPTRENHSRRRLHAGCRRLLLTIGIALAVAAADSAAPMSDDQSRQAIINQSVSDYLAAGHKGWLPRTAALFLQPVRNVPRERGGDEHH